MSFVNRLLPKRTGAVRNTCLRRKELSEIKRYELVLQ